MAFELKVKKPNASMNVIPGQQPVYNQDQAKTEWDRINNPQPNINNQQVVNNNPQPPKKTNGYNQVAGTNMYISNSYFKDNDPMNDFNTKYSDAINDMSRNNSTGGEVDLATAREMFKNDAFQYGKEGYTPYGNTVITQDTNNDYNIGYDRNMQAIQNKYNAMATGEQNSSKGQMYLNSINRYKDGGSIGNPNTGNEVLNFNNSLNNNTPQISQETSMIDNFIKSSGREVTSPTKIKSTFSMPNNPDEQIMNTSNGYFAKVNGHMMEIREDQYVNMMLSLNGFNTNIPYSSEKKTVNNSFDSKSMEKSNESGQLVDASNSINATPSNKVTAKYKTYVENDPEKAGKMDGFIDSAKSMINFKYSQANRMAKDSVDCSSLIGRAMKMAGITDNDMVTTESMKTDKRFTKISKAEIKPGDILWEKGHAAIFLGNNKTLEARYSTQKVGESTVGNRFEHAYRINV